MNADPSPSKNTSLTSVNPRFTDEQEQDTTITTPTQDKQQPTMRDQVHDNEDEPLLMDAITPSNIKVTVPSTSTITTTLGPLTNQPPAAPPALRPRKPFVSVRATYLRALNAAKGPQHALFKR